MGHTWREMYPKEAREQDERIARWLKIKKELDSIPLSNFTAGELSWLSKFYSGSGECSEYTMEHAEKRLAEIKKTQNP